MNCAPTNGVEVETNRGDMYAEQSTSITSDSTGKIACP